MIAIITFFSDVNYLAVFAAGLAYFILGALWYSVLFGKIWAAGITEMGIKMTKPDQSRMMTMMFKSLLANMLSAFAMAFLINHAGDYDLMAGIKLGIVCGCGIALGSLLMTANWQGTKTNVLMIDSFYQIIGLVIVGAIISSWH